MWGLFTVMPRTSNKETPEESGPGEDRANKPSNPPAEKQNEKKQRERQFNVMPRTSRYTPGSHWFVVNFFAFHSIVTSSTF